ncbi:MAG: hypothetical protein EOO65_01465 [Methanosarcinales archaeon]|nr:MAG: hypothetical protein EOO65_01465 [Methanosarcinales archaeon]
MVCAGIRAAAKTPLPDLNNQHHIRVFEEKKKQKYRSKKVENDREREEEHTKIVTRKTNVAEDGYNDQ